MPDWVLSSGSHEADSEVWVGLRSHLEFFPAPVLVAECSSLRWGGLGGPSPAGWQLGAALIPSYLPVLLVTQPPFIPKASNRESP